jgi:hypothetical protein
VIPDYGGRDETFTVVTIDPPIALVYRSRRGRTDVTWSILLRPDGEQTRVLLRLRLGPVPECGSPRQRANSSTCSPSPPWQQACENDSPAPTRDRSTGRRLG